MAKLYYWSGANWYDSNSIAHQETGISTVNQATTNAIIFALLVLRELVNYFGQVQKFNEVQVQVYCTLFKLILTVF